MAAYLHPQSKFHGNPLLVDRIKLAAGYMERNQHADGFIDYRDTNFDSPPDTGFTIHNLATAACLAKRANRPDLLAITEPYMRKAGAGLVVGGIHTPNHRWVVCSALAQINEVFPDPSYIRRIDQWLQEGVDIDGDGQFTERSTSVYNAICDRAFLVMAVKLGRPALFEPVRKNLDSMLYLLHSDYDVVTEISRRQDRDQRSATMAAFWFPLQYLAVKDGNGQFATLANHLAPQFGEFVRVYGISGNGRTYAHACSAARITSNAKCARSALCGYGAAPLVRLSSAAIPFSSRCTMAMLRLKAFVLPALSSGRGSFPLPPLRSRARTTC